MAKKHHSPAHEKRRQRVGKSKSRLVMTCDWYRVPALRVAGCCAVWPWAVGVVKEHRGAALPDALHPRLCAADLGLPVAVAEKQLRGAFELGLMVEGADGRVRVRDWERFQLEPRVSQTDYLSRLKTRVRASDRTVREVVMPTEAQEALVRDEDAFDAFIEDCRLAQVAPPRGLREECVKRLMARRVRVDDIFLVDEDGCAVVMMAG